MPVNMRYRSIQSARILLTRYLTAAFKAHAKGAVMFTDGTYKIEFSKEPVVVSQFSWTERDLPAVLVSDITATYEERTFSSNLLQDASSNDTLTQNTYGGDLDMTVVLKTRATTLLELDNLVDMTCILMAGKTAKNWFINQDIKLPKPPIVGAASQVNEPDIDYNIYSTDITIELHSTWVEYEDAADRLIDIIVDIDTELQL